jgi:type VI secretion system protein ImpA
VDLRYDPLYDKIKEARREDDDAPQGEWQRARKVADWPLVIKLASEALATKSKDLQLAAWLAEAMLRREGLSGFRESLDLLRGLIDQYWDHLYPELEDGDAEMRAAPLEWVGGRLVVPVKSVPLDRAGHSYFAYMEARAAGYEADAEDDPGKAARRSEMNEEGKPTLEEIDKSFAETPKAFYKKLAADVAGVFQSLQALDDLARERFGEFAPSFIKLREAMEEEERLVGQLLAKKLELEPDPPELATAVDVSAAGNGAIESGPAHAGSGEMAPAGSGALSAEPGSAADAIARIVGSARYLRHADPLSPVPYLTLRALRWGELRAAGRAPDPRLLEAPTTQVRTQLRGLMLDASWEQLLELSEAVMGTPVGRGWLDLQRYALTACQGLGDEYTGVASAIRSELRALLSAIPSLPRMTLMDDMPTATSATMEWLREEGLIATNGDDPAPEAEPVMLVGAEVREREGQAGLERATAEVRAGRPEKAVEMLMRALDREKTRRGRFLRQAELARIMVDAGFVQAARPILEELMADIEAHKLEAWEAGEMVARPLALLYRCLMSLDTDDDRRQELYVRVARLDPLQAIGFGQG